MPLAGGRSGRRSQRRRFCLLRERGRYRPLLLRRPCPHGLPPAGAAARLRGAASLGVELIRGVVTFFVTAPLLRDVAARWAAKSIHSRNQEEGRELLGIDCCLRRQVLRALVFTSWVLI